MLEITIHGVKNSVQSCLEWLPGRQKSRRRGERKNRAKAPRKCILDTSDTNDTNDTLHRGLWFATLPSHHWRLNRRADRCRIIPIPRYGNMAPLRFQLLPPGHLLFLRELISRPQDFSRHPPSSSTMLFSLISLLWRVGFGLQVFWESGGDSFFWPVWGVVFFTSMQFDAKKGKSFP